MPKETAKPAKTTAKAPARKETAAAAKKETATKAKPAAAAAAKPAAKIVAPAPELATITKGKKGRQAVPEQIGRAHV